MILPNQLQESLTEIAKHYAPSALQQAYLKLSTYYRNNREQIAFSLNSDLERLAYVLARMPATYAAVERVLQEVLPFAENLKSILDVGAGPGTASWASCETFSELENIQLIEQNQGMIEIGKKLALNQQKMKNANWLQKNVLNSLDGIQSADLVLASYSFNEISEKDKEHFLSKFWEKTGQFFVLIEPGTPLGFQSVTFARNFFLKSNANILAPCPHSLSCPALNKQDWCHFATRLQRTSMHKNLKMGEKGFEDEKFSYLIVSKNNLEKHFNARITRHPEVHSGHLKLNLCTKDGFILKTHSKKDGQKYKEARKAEWGDSWNL
ncbi:small ribosomal subunit Rsm22 family protein [Pigmentibacter sp. JX0631]|uniref:small ribosomal subunit Rsm22 family protein n=1 Tax=Pigmentibacter sp. JX0631 TaxID=2976982 RepID=UPI002469709A|nr:small ribosomal subunit Rsm22 family protein [Pigmentibacter sp. JX0631]WGL58666.1 small ribosomal subunit Rsm22 family protein [Pigmentibacter sp. JX0631]